MKIATFLEFLDETNMSNGLHIDTNYVGNAGGWPVLSLLASPETAHGLHLAGKPC